MGRRIGCGRRRAVIGRNRRVGIDDWATRCEIVVADRPREFTWAVLGDAALPAPRPAQESSRWGYRFNPRGDATEVEESWRKISLSPRYFELSDAERQELVDGTHASIEGTLARLKRAVEQA
jgi:hypothetical protein